MEGIGESKLCFIAECGGDQYENLADSLVLKNPDIEGHGNLRGRNLVDEVTNKSP